MWTWFETAKFIYTIVKAFQGILYSRLVRIGSYDFKEDGEDLCAVAYSLQYSTGEKSTFIGFVLPGKCSEVLPKFEFGEQERVVDGEPLIGRVLNLPKLRAEYLIARAIVNYVELLMERDVAWVTFTCSEEHGRACIEMCYWQRPEWVGIFIGQMYLPEISCSEVMSEIVTPEFISKSLRLLRERYPHVYEEVLAASKKIRGGVSER